jgi:hypothetical protein
MTSTKKSALSDRAPTTPGGGMLIYQTEDGKIRLEARLVDGTVWLTQKMMAELFQVTVPTINEHITNVFVEEELSPGATIRKFRIVQTEGTRYRRTGLSLP